MNSRMVCVNLWFSPSQNPLGLTPSLLRSIQIFVFVLACGLQYGDALYVKQGPMLAKQMSLGPLGTFYQNSMMGGGGSSGGSGGGGGMMDQQWVKDCNIHGRSRTEQVPFLFPAALSEIPFRLRGQWLQNGRHQEAVGDEGWRRG